MLSLQYEKYSSLSYPTNCIGIHKFSNNHTYMYTYFILLLAAIKATDVV